jgi:membrane protease YdiL (CAAX protease family)
MKYLQVLSQLGFFILPAIVFGFFVNKNISHFFHLEKSPKITVLLLGLFTIIAAVPFSDWLIYQNNLMKLPASMADIEEWMRTAEEKAAYMTNLFLQMDSLSDYLINILMIGILAAVGEELLLRGVLQPLFIKITKNAHAGIWIAAFVFSFIHFQFYGFFARLFMGAILGYLFYYTNDLWIPIIVHFFNNSAAVTYVYITNTPLDSTNLSEIAIQENGGLYAIISLFSVVFGLYVLYTMKQKAAISS